MPSVHTARRRIRRRTAVRRGGGDDRGTVCLVLCGIVFVLLVAVKLLFPETAEKLAGAARQMISQDADFEEAFAAVGRMVSGETPASDALQDAYTAVFNPTSQLEADPEPKPVPEPEPEPEEPEPAVQSPLRQTVLALPEAEKTVTRELVLTPAGEGETDPAAEPVESGSSAAYAMAALPENASLEQRNLGFEHCTPVQGRLTSTFGWREHPVEGGNRFHYGVDLGAATGTDIVAFADGEVYAVGESSSLGNYIMLRHEGDYVTLYAHCSRVTATGGSVSQGEKIAEVGATGIVTGPHLHFELHDRDLRLNPIYYVEVG